MASILVAGATGALGRPLVAELSGRGHRVVALGRDAERLARLEGASGTRVADLTEPATLAGACEGVDVVVSCAGAPVTLGGWRERKPFEAVDFRGNLALLDTARRAGVDRFVYVSAHGAPGMRELAYAEAHERLVDALRSSGLDRVVVRPTGFFSTFREILVQAGSGRGWVVGRGDAPTNPIHEADLAAFVADAMEGSERELAVGGPRSHTRREIVEMAFRAVGSVPRVRSLPPWAARGAASAIHPFNPRLSALLRFGVEVGLRPAVAPAHGTRTLEAYFAGEAPAVVGDGGS